AYLGRLKSAREASALGRAEALTLQAEALAPNESRVLILRFRVELARGEEKKPAEALARFEAAFPGDPRAFLLRAELAEHDGPAAAAIPLLVAVVARTPAWPELLHLAKLERDVGRLADARLHLRQLLAVSPNNLWGREALAVLELTYGDPAAAERLYQKLAAELPRERSLWTDLGLARFLAGRFEAAIEAHRRALALAPRHATVLLNLADAELASGRRVTALGHYRDALASFQETEAATGLPPEARLEKAQCLAHLGRTDEAVELAQLVLRDRPGEPEIAFEAALVYALAGDRTSALINARAAWRQGYGPAWFGIAAFDFLKDDPELRTRLAAARAP
ncbi:MAG TPA: tetratricopeptide repeat protein, partial [Thermoanaerobaculia bacterium]|nr:tetratricopeptide repeat protein [Thermoanaerobaculia bacterium]